MKDLNLRRFRYFFEVYQRGSISAASESLNTSPSVVTRQIQLLEDELQTVLFERHSRGLRPTESARHLSDFWNDLHARYEQFEDRLSALRGLQVGAVHLAVSEGYVPDLSEHVIRKFNAQYPGVEIRVDVMPVGHIVDSVADGRAHIGIAFNPEPRPDIEVVYSVCQPAELLIRADHPLARRKTSVSIAELFTCKLALMPVENGLGQLLHTVAHDEKVELRPALISNSIAMIREFVLGSSGAALISGFEQMRRKGDHTLVALPIDHPLLLNPRAALIVKRGRPLGVAAEYMLTSIPQTMKLFTKVLAPTRSTRHRVALRKD
ncbi:LysR family transcriptional regulator [Paraburkholderia flava]|uniref:LysR family transcriptional regulator n=1 Tax=Paraburkholderia flava TaxID=2547393 RepID=UPI00105B4717|nr:LysR family transcriptional regulator [Paraburkholderia flava]